MSAKEFQASILLLLQSKLRGLGVQSEWVAFSGQSYQYSPRVDIAVGPFSTQPGLNKIAEYNSLLRQRSVLALLKKIYDYHIINVSDEVYNEIINLPFNTIIQKNQNARCLLAFEIENSSTKKHIMGSMVNAASLGRLGIGVAYNASVLRTFLRILNYMAFLKRVEKNSYDTTNFLIITKEQMLEVLK